MRVYRIEYEGAPKYVLERDGRVALVEGELFDEFRVGREIGRIEPDGPSDRLGGHRILAPLVPSKVIGIGLNYRLHAQEQNKPVPAEPMLFLKPPSAVIGPGEAICVPRHVGRVDHEAEVGVVIGKRASHVPRERARDHVFGITAVNDVTAREMQRKGFQYSHVKGFDTFCPIGPCIALGAEEPIAVEGWVNGERRQSSTTADLIFPIEELIAYLSSIMTLVPGDVIATGTPSGIGPLQPGDRVRVHVAGVGDLENPVL